MKILEIFKFLANSDSVQQNPLFFALVKSRAPEESATVPIALRFFTIFLHIIYRSNSIRRTLHGVGTPSLRIEPFNWSHRFQSQRLADGNRTDSPNDEHKNFCTRMVFVECTMRCIRYTLSIRISARIDSAGGLPAWSPGSAE